MPNKGIYEEEYLKGLTVNVECGNLYIRSIRATVVAYRANDKEAERFANIAEAFLLDMMDSGIGVKLEGSRVTISCELNLENGRIPIISRGESCEVVARHLSTVTERVVDLACETSVVAAILNVLPGAHMDPGIQ